MTKKYSYKDTDIEGEETLNTIAQANRFNEWMYQVIAHHCSGKILEIGSGIGNISKYFLEKDYELILSDIRDQYCDQLRKAFPENKVINIDLVDENFDEKFKMYFSQFDTVFALNVIEHIEDDKIAINNLCKLLKKGGKCIILVPAFNFLYNSFDKELYHFRRYNRKKLNHLLSHNLNVIHSRYFNPIGILGWFINGNILKKKLIPSGQMKIFDQFVPFYKFVDYFSKPFIGLSVISVGVKR